MLAVIFLSSGCALLSGLHFAIVIKNKDKSIYSYSHFWPLDYFNRWDRWGYFICNNRCSILAQFTVYVYSIKISFLDFFYWHVYSVYLPMAIIGNTTEMSDTVVWNYVLELFSWMLGFLSSLMMELEVLKIQK